MPRTIAGQVIAITGGARGIGRATASALVKRGARVALGDLDEGLVGKAAEELGGGTVGLGLDVADRASVSAFLDTVESRLGPIDVLINNAGVMLIGAFETEDERTTRRMIDVNLYGVIHGSQLAMTRMLARRAGHIINVASGAGKAGFPHAATYCATKHAVVGLSESMRLELAGTGVEVSCVMPAIVNTELTSGLLTKSRLVARVEPEDVAAAIVEAIEEPHFDVYVPKSLGTAFRVTSLLPRRVREALAHRAGALSTMTHIDSAAREAYTKRAKSE